MRIAVVFQQRQNQKEDFDELKGFAAGLRAYRYAQDSIRQTAGSAIYFSVDFDAAESEIVTHVAPFFAGVKRAFAEESGGSPKYRVGTYGSGLVCSALTARGLSEFTWLAMSRGFRGTREALQAGNFHLAQRAPATKVCGLDVDINDHNPDRPDFGAFIIAGDPAPAVPVTRRRTAGARLTG